MVSRTRGRPPKFGRPARLVALTLPEDTIDALKTVNTDLGRAVVTLVDGAHGGSTPIVDQDHGPVTLAHVNDTRALIVIDPKIFREIPGCALIPFSDSRAFLALEPGRTLADLELSVADRVDEDGLPPSEREALNTLRRSLRDWRRDESLSFHTRSIVLVERAGRHR